VDSPELKVQLFDKARVAPSGVEGQNSKLQLKINPKSETLNKFQAPNTKFQIIFNNQIPMTEILKQEIPSTKHQIPNNIQ